MAPRNEELVAPLSQFLDDVRLKTTIFGSSGSSPKPDKIVGQIESGLTEVYCILCILQHCCDKTMDDKMALYRECCLPNCMQNYGE